MTSHRRRNTDRDQHFEIDLPPEARQEDRIEHGHTSSEWKFRQEEYNHRCAYCGIHKLETPEKYLTRDHIIAVIHYGTDEISNIVPACVRCNKRKSHYAPGQWDNNGFLIPLPKPRKRFRRW